MSPNVGNFVHDLVEMAKAMETLPTVQQELAEARVTIDAQSATIQRLEGKLMDRNNEIESLQSNIRRLEEARDDAELRFLEVEDKLGRVLNLVRGMGETLGQAVVTLEPPKPVEPMTEPVSVSIGSYTVQSPSPEATPDPVTGTYWSSSDEAKSNPTEPAVSPSDPTAPSTAGDGHSPETATAIPSAEHGADASSPVKVDRGPYYGKAWSEVRHSQGWAPYSKDEWLAGGGTESAYYL